MAVDIAARATQLNAKGRRPERWGYPCHAKSEAAVPTVRLRRGTLTGRYYRGDILMVGTRVSCKKWA